ncbi:MAG: stage III sporulation protein AE, partial [Clostridia bacterium]|nr:stage III sporulation protein AE [Clostridia bacterium]
LMSAALGVVNNLSENINAQKLVQFLNKVSKWGIGLVMTLFVGVMGLQGLVSGSADGLTVKVTKFAASNLIPLVGGALAETVETVMNCSVVIKNAVGVLGIIMVVLIVAVPVLKVAACLMMFRLCAAVLQPISDKRIVKCISELADSISSVFGIMMVVSVMFIIMLTIIINVGSTAALLGR